MAHLTATEKLIGGLHISPSNWLRWGSHKSPVVAGRVVRFMSGAKKPKRLKLFP